MGTVTEDSMASVPLSELMRLQDRLLQPQDGSVAIMHLGGAASATAVPNTQRASTEIAVSIPESANVYRTPNSSPKTPRIATSKSASAAEMETMANPSPSQEAFRALTRASSFHGYPCGDTQPMESQVYRDFNESRAKSTTTSPNRPAPRTSPREGDRTYDTAMTERTPKTCVEGDTGFVDLANAFPSPATRSVLSTMDDLLTSPETLRQVEENVAEGAALPKTPSIAGHKRKRSAEIPTSIATDLGKPGYSQFFGQNVPVMTTTQLFNQTQAPSSPVPDGPRSDPVITRPSPSAFHPHSVSSPSLPVSSPFVSMRPVTAGGPRDRYLSVFESQQQRNKGRSSVELGVAPDIDDAILNEDEEDSDAERRRFEYKRMQEAKSEQILQEFERLRAPSRNTSRPTSSAGKAVPIDLTTPAAIKTGNPFDFEPSEDGEQDDEEVVLENEDGEYNNANDDEYDEFGQTVLRSQGPDPEESDNELDESNDANGYDEKHGSVMSANASSVGAQQAGNTTHENDLGTPRLTTQEVAIADSQPMRDKPKEAATLQPVQGAPPISSFVPGSQHTGSTSQEQAQTKARRLGRIVLSSNRQTKPNLLSSPTLPIVSSALPRNSAEPLDSTSEDASNQAGETTIPESDLPGLEQDQDNSSRPATAEGYEDIANNNQHVFSTAATHHSEAKTLSPQRVKPHRSSRKLLPNQNSNEPASPSPLKAAGVRRFADITASQPLPRGESRETDADVDAFMKEFIPVEDQEFIEAVSSPPPKRRRLDRASSAHMPSSPNKHNYVNAPRKKATDDAHAEELLWSNTFNADATAKVMPKVTSALQESPSKANEMPTSTQESVAEREKAGAKAVSQLVSNRVSKLPRSTSGNSKPPGKKLKLKAGKSTDAQEVHLEAEVPATMVEDVLEVNEMPADGAGLEHMQATTARIAKPPSELISTPNRVFALFKGSYNKFYPAIWLGSTADGTAYRVKFNDAPRVSIEKQHVRKLELRVGDMIKVDFKDMRSQTWVVKGFDNVASSHTDETADTDVHGHHRVQVEAKSNRTSHPKSGTTVAGASEVVEVPISAVYLTHTLWPQFASRTFNPPTAPSAIASRQVTPSSSTHTRQSETPLAKARRTIMPTAKAAAGRTTNLREDMDVATVASNADGMFNSMVFALSYGQNSGEKEDVARLIRQNGGIIVEHGFDEMFDLPAFDDALDSEGGAKKQDVGLHLKDAYKDVGFAALIADKHSRRAKYMQALALNLPTLSGKWVMDSLSASKNQTLSTTDALPLPWSKYLLPAGESTYLNGAIRSRTMSAYPCKEARLQETVNSRDTLLRGDDVLIVTPKKGKVNMERIKTYAFLTLALGASNVRRVTDLDEARTLAAEQSELGKWIYVDGPVAEAGDIVFGKASKAGKKRKRGDESTSTDLDKMFAADGKVRVVSDEFVIQSLILGALVD